MNRMNRMRVPIGAMGGPKKRLQVREDLNVYRHQQEQDDKVR